MARKELTHEEPIHTDISTGKTMLFSDMSYEYRKNITINMKNNALAYKGIHLTFKNEQII